MKETLTEWDCYDWECPVVSYDAEPAVETGPPHLSLL